MDAAVGSRFFEMPIPLPLGTFARQRQSQQGMKQFPEQHIQPVYFHVRC